MSGEQIAIRVQSADLGLVAGAPLDIGFKWADNCLGAQPDPTDFIVNGDCAPNARFAYHFRTANAAQAEAATPLVSGQVYALKNRASGLVALTPCHCKIKRCVSNEKLRASSHKTDVFALARNNPRAQRR